MLFRSKTYEDKVLKAKGAALALEKQLYDEIFDQIVFTMDTKREIISLTSEKMVSNIDSVRYLLSLNKEAQYNVSLASFRATCILFIKSALLCANFASLINAPIAVPLRNTCFDNTYSFFSLVRKECNRIIRNAKSYDLLYTILPFIVNYKEIRNEQRYKITHNS